MWIKWKYNDHGHPDFKELEIPDDLGGFSSVEDWICQHDLVPTWGERFMTCRIKWEKLKLSKAEIKQRQIAKCERYIDSSQRTLEYWKDQLRIAMNELKIPEGGKVCIVCEGKKMLERGKFTKHKVSAISVKAKVILQHNLFIFIMNWDIASDLNDHDQKRLKNTLFMVEATHFESYTLWSHHAQDSLWPPRCRDGQLFYPSLRWEQENPGALIQIGKIDKRPVTLCLYWNIIEYQRICFYEMTSQVTDSKLLDEWLDKNFTRKWDNGTRRAITDATNFGHCIAAIREANKQKISLT